MDNEKKVKVWEEYTGKANNFSDWFTAVIISNFAYLIGLLDKEVPIVALLNGKLYLWRWSFYTTCASLASIFIVKALGVWAASERVHKGLSDFQENIETARVPFICFFGLCGIASLILSGRILMGIFRSSL